VSDRRARTRVRRIPDRGVYEPQAIHAILDDAMVCHVGVVDDGHPLVVPTLHARDGDRLLIHGSSASRTMRLLSAGEPATVTATNFDGLVLARSAFHHSVNYRSATVFGRATPITDDAAKLAALELFLERFTPGRWQEVREPTRKELKGTSIVALPLDEASAKVRTGPPVDDEEDYALDVWAGVIPYRLERGDPVPDPRMA
jgi:nitroimidazol reductase NimA-like FMN-containing flavoprotein (pyridoxamine 5'-phosphate oxidase superfamily)